MACYVYILRCNDSSLYTGWTVDLTRRINMHNSGKASKYTCSRRPVELVYFEELPDKREAMRRECAIKKLSRSQKIKLVASFVAPLSI